MERKGKKLVPLPQHPPKRCPRCKSTDTKFCYFNNYSQSQPRHYCKACRRYWTEGGALRNVPQGGGGDHKSKRRKKTTAVGDDPAVSAASMLFDPADKSVAGLSAGPPVGALPLSPQSSLFFKNGGIREGLMGLQGGNHTRFHSGRGIMADFGDHSATMPLMLPGFLNFPFGQQQNLLPLVEPSMIIQRTAASRHQLLANTSTVLAATTAGPSVSAAAGYTREEGFWNVFGNGAGGVSAGLPPPQT